MARIPLPTADSLTDPAAKERWDRLAGGGPVLNVRRLFLVNPTVQLSAGRLWAATGLDDRSREIVILRCAAARQSTYEWHQHVRIATGVGLSAAEINAVRTWQNADCFSPAERVLLAYVDELAIKQRPDDAVFAAMAEGRSAAEVFGVTMLITQYFQLAHVMAAMDLETEAPFVGWEVGAKPAARAKRTARAKAASTAAPAKAARTAAPAAGMRKPASKRRPRPS